MWAGEASHEAARALKEFLEVVVQGPRYFISDDIDGGQMWRAVLARQLESSGFGIACLTAESLKSHWLHFEAGALSKAVGKDNVVPYLIGAKATDVDGPLSDFQMITADEAGTLKLASLLASRIDGMSSAVTERSFSFVWPNLAKKLTSLAVPSTVPREPVRNDTALIQEVLERVRRLEGFVSPPQASLMASPEEIENAKLAVLVVNTKRLIRSWLNKKISLDLSMEFERLYHEIHRKDISLIEAASINDRAKSLASKAEE